MVEPNSILFLAPMLIVMGAACAALFFAIVEGHSSCGVVFGFHREDAPSQQLGVCQEAGAVGVNQMSKLPERTRSNSFSPRRTVLEFSRINAAALAALPALLTRWLPDGYIEGRREYVARNPRRNDTRPGSFKINLNTGAWADFATGDKGGDVISLAAYLAGIRQGEAARRLADLLGVR